jgi:hypothetical protein
MDPYEELDERLEEMIENLAYTWRLIGQLERERERTLVALRSLMDVANRYVVGTGSKPTFEEWCKAIGDAEDILGDA